MDRAARRVIVTALAGLRDGNPAADSESEHRGHEDLRNE
jgi:hypothetical protein